MNRETHSLLEEWTLMERAAGKAIAVNNAVIWIFFRSRMGCPSGIGHRQLIQQLSERMLENNQPSLV